MACPKEILCALEKPMWSAVVKGVFCPPWVSLALTPHSFEVFCFLLATCLIVSHAVESEK